MARTMLVVSNPDYLARIPELIQQAGISFDRKEGNGHQFFYCRHDQAEVWVIVAPQQTWIGNGSDRKTIEFHPVFVQAKPGFFRWFFQGSADRALQERILRALESIRDLELIMK